MSAKQRLPASTSRWVQVANPFPIPGCATWQKTLKDGHLTVIVGEESGGWHLSISHRTNHDPPRPGRYPRWGEIKEARYRFVPDGVTMCMVLPPEREYVNLADTCFHLWEHARWRE